MTDLREQIAEIMEDGMAVLINADSPEAEDAARIEIVDRLHRLHIEGDRIEGYASQCMSSGPPYDPIPGCWEIVAAAYADDDDRTDRRATLILHPETSE